MRLITLALTVLILAASGCRHLPAIGEEEPPWVAGPEAAEHSSRFLTAIGTGDSAPSRQNKLHEAEDDARTELARKIEDYSRSALEGFLQSRPDLTAPGAGSEFASAVSARTTGSLLRRTVHHDTWYNSSQEAVYVLYRLSLPAVNRAVLQEARAAAQTMDPFPAHDEEAIEELRRFLDSQLKERVARAARQKQKQSPAPHEPTTPGWLTHGRDEDFPPEQYLVATGLGQDRPAAENSVRGELFAALRKKVRATIGRRSVNDTSLAANLQTLSARTLRLQEDDLPPVHVRKYWFDEVTGTWYTLGVIDRREVLKEYGKRIEELARRCRDLFHTARNNHRADNYLTALEEYLLSLRYLQQKVRSHLVYLAVRQDSGEQPVVETDAPPVTEIRQRLEGLLAELTLKKTGGDKQWVPPGAKPREPLAVQLLAGAPAQPVAGMPLRFQFNQGEGTVQQRATTEDEGRAAVRVESLRSTGRSYATVDCTPAPHEIVEETDLSGMQVPSATFRLILRSIENTRLAVHVEEQFPVDTDCGVGVAVSDALREAGFALLSEDQLPASIRQSEFAGDPSAGRIREAFRPLAEQLAGEAFVLAVYGRASAEVVEQRETSEGTLHFVHVPVTIRVVDPTLPEDPTVLEMSVVGKDAYAGDKEEAFRRACAKAARLAANRLVQGMNRRFPRH